MLTPDQGFVQTAAPPKPKLEAIVQAIPHSLDAEEGLLGALAIDPAQMLNAGYLRPDDFYLSSNAAIYRAMTDLWEKHQGYDLITLTEHLETAGQLENIGGAGIIADMINFTPTSYNAGHYAAIIYKNSVLRQTINASTKAAQLAYAPGDRSAAEVANEAVGMLSEIDATRNVSGGPQPMRAGVDALLDRLEQIEESGQIMGLQTGINTLDHTLGGFGDKKFYLLAGRPGMGKSALAIQIAYNVAKRGIPVLFFALEMSKEDIAARLTSLVSGIPYESFNRPAANGNFRKIIEAAEEVSSLPIIIDDTPALTASDIRSRAQKIMISEDVGIVMIDHGGIIRPERTMGNKYADQSQIADSLMALPKQLGCPVLSLLQLSRQLENRQDKRPMIHDLRDSGKWEENADGIMFLYRDEVYNPDTEFPHLGEIGIAKNRGGKTGVATLYTNIGTNKFFDLETRKVTI